MNYSTAIFLVNDAVRAVATSYEVDAEGKGKRPFATYKTMDHTLKVGDYVVVPTDTRHGRTVVRIEDVGIEVDPACQTQLSWVIAPVDETASNEIIEQEALAIIRIKSAEKARARKELAEKLLEDNPDIAQLRGLSMGAAPALQAPPAPVEAPEA